jgi:dolichol-phosphate mannosyltransferase
VKLSIIIPVYYNEDNLIPLYEDIKDKIYCHQEFEYELVMVDDGSKDKSYEVMKKLAQQDKRIKILSLSRNFGSHAAILCGLSHCTGDCAIVKAADLQEPTELILEMAKKWEMGYKVVLAVRESRDESYKQVFFANLYYSIVRKFALPTMPKNGFDIYLVDRKVIQVLTSLDEKNSALTGQILWSGFKTTTVSYNRLAREIGTSKWTLKKKIGLVTNTLFSFSRVPIHVVTAIGVISFFGAIIWAIVELVAKLSGAIEISGFTTLFIFQLLSFGIIMSTLGILGSYLWRTFDASRNRPPYIVEELNEEEKEE